MLENTLLIQLYIFVLAVFAGFEIITKVPPTLHTPLMSGANAISGITLLGAIVVTVQADGATINVVGGFVVTDRMLRMFRRAPR